ncbi:Rv2175c family DNA-binding protein [uncultured Jatrophihabitans sp.]|uniref:Rv2175c family DNA-binding protein n=1 Tax=uncultured Jatrophihabitans sp. TaxID=1610747 RepID=UPI0035C962CF
MSAEPVSGVDLLPVPEVAELLGIKVNRVHQHVRDGQLLLVRRADGTRGVPALLILDGAVVKHLPSVITQLRDARFADDEIVDWLHREDDSLPGSPIEALRANRGAEVKRRAQVAGY